MSALPDLHGGHTPQYFPAVETFESAGITEPKGKGAPHPRFVLDVYSWLCRRADPSADHAIAVSGRELGKALYLKPDTARKVLAYLIDDGVVAKDSQGSYRVIPKHLRNNRPNNGSSSDPITGHFRGVGVTQKRVTSDPITGHDPITDRPNNGSKVTQKRVTQRPNNGSHSLLESLERENIAAAAFSKNGAEAICDEPAAATFSPSKKSEKTEQKNGDEIDDPAGRMTPLDLGQLLDSQPTIFRRPRLDPPSDLTALSGYLDAAVLARLEEKRAAGKPADNPDALGRVVWEEFRDDTSKAQRCLKRVLEAQENGKRAAAAVQREAEERAQKRAASGPQWISPDPDPELDAPSVGFRKWVESRLPAAHREIARVTRECEGAREAAKAIFERAEVAVTSAPNHQVASYRRERELAELTRAFRALEVL